MNHKFLAVTVSFLLIIGCLGIAGCHKKPSSSASSSSSPDSEESSVPELPKPDYIVQPTLDYDGTAYPFTNGYAVVYKELNPERYAYMDKNGNLLGNGFIYRKASTFNYDGLAVVEYDDGTYAFIDKTGNKVLDSFDGKKFTDENGTPSKFMGGLSLVSKLSIDGFVSAVINTNGEFVIPFDTDNNYDYGPFSDFVSVRKAPDDSDAVVDTDGKVLFESDVNICSDFSAGAAFYSSDQLYGIIDKSGNTVTDPIFSWYGGRPFTNGLAFVVFADPLKGAAIIDTSGNVICSLPNMKDAVIYDTDIVAKGNDSLFYLYDLSGKKLCDTGFSHIDGFSEGYSCFVQNNKKGLIDSKGNIILPAQYDDMTCGQGLVTVMVNGKLGIMEIPK